VRIGRELDDVNALCQALYNQAMLLCSLGDHIGTMTSLAECLPLSRTAGCWWSPKDLVPFLAEALCTRGETQAAMQLIGAVEAADPKLRDTYGDHVYDDITRVETGIRDALGGEAAEDALAQGRKLDLNTLLDELLGQTDE
jgi:hypothetical protein